MTILLGPGRMPLRPPVTETGLRGYFTWLKQDQPSLFRAVAPVIAQQVPDVISSFNQSVTMGILQGMTANGTGGGLAAYLRGLADGDDDLTSIDTSAPISGVSAASVPNIFPNPITGVTAPSLLDSSAPNIDLSTTANTGTTDSGTISQISNIVGSAVNAATGGSSAGVNFLAANQAQLQNAAAGRSPLPYNSAAQGQAPIQFFGNTGLTVNEVVYGLAGVLALLLIVSAARR